MKVILYMAISTNGYIAKTNDETPWSDEEWESFKQMSEACGNIILGKRTFDLAVANGDFPFTDSLHVICTTKKAETSTFNNTFFVNSPSQALALLERKGFETAMVGGGGTLNSAFLEEELVDEIYLDVEPLLFGKGLPLFSMADFTANLELLETKKLNKNTLQLHYKVLK